MKNKLIKSAVMLLGLVSSLLMAGEIDYKYKVGDTGPNGGFIVYVSAFEGRYVEMESRDVSQDYPFEDSEYGKLATWFTGMTMDWDVDNLYTWRLPSLHELEELKYLEDSGTSTKIRELRYWTNENRQDENGTWMATSYSFQKPKDLKGNPRIMTHGAFGNRAMRLRLARNLVLDKVDICEEIDRLSDADKFKYAFENLNADDKTLLQKSECALHFKVGDKGLAGGWVYYLLNEEGTHGYETSHSDLKGTYGCTLVHLNGTASKRYIGGGRANTAAMLARGCGDTGTIAPKITLFKDSGFHDWFIPSIGSLQEMHDKIREIGNFVLTAGNSADTVYLSSTVVFGYHTTLARDFSIYNQHFVWRDYEHATRPVREF